MSIILSVMDTLTYNLIIIFLLPLFFLYGWGVLRYRIEEQYVRLYLSKTSIKKRKKKSLFDWFFLRELLKYVPLLLRILYILYCGILLASFVLAMVFVVLWIISYELKNTIIVSVMIYIAAAMLDIRIIGWFVDLLNGNIKKRN